MQRMTWAQTLTSYLDKRLLCIFLLGCSSGFPWLITGSALSGWLKDEGLSRTNIGFFGAAAAVYTINFFWSPLVDRVKIPFLHNMLGMRRSWIICCQSFMLIFTLGLSTLHPNNDLVLMSLFILVIAAMGATQDIAIDAFRIDTFASQDKHKISQGSAMAVIGWNTGFLIPGFFAFSNAGDDWNHVYVDLALAFIPLILFTLFATEPKSNREELQQEAELLYARELELSDSELNPRSNASKILTWLAVTTIEPFMDFFRRNGKQVAIALLLFVFLFKIGEAFLGRMSLVFYKDIGFTNEQIGYYSKLIGWGVTTLFTLIGGMFSVRFGIVKGLMLGGIAMASSNLMFAWLAWAGPNEHIYLATVLIDGCTTGFATMAFVSFLTTLTGQAFSATQYALLASLGNLGRTVLASSSGIVIDYLDDWSLFFIITALMVTPSLCLLYYLRHYFADILNNTNITK